MINQPGPTLMITPFAKIQRGNSLTTARIQAGLTTRGFKIDVFSLEDQHWRQQLPLTLEQSAYSLIHGFNARYLGQVLLAVPALRKLPIILTTTGTDIHYDLWGPRRDIILEAMQAAQKIVLFHDDFRWRLQASFPEFRDKLTTIPQGVFLEAGSAKTRQELGLSLDEFIFLLPSGLRAVKNIELAIDALAALYQDYPVFRLLIIGAIIEEEYSCTIMERIGSLPWVTYLGEIPHEQMAGILTCGDVVLNTSYSEGQPQAALEAMSMGKPCILTAVPGNLNLIEPGREGYYVKSRQELISAARTLLNNHTLREEMGHNARMLIETRFSLNQEIDAYHRLYEETAYINKT